MNLRPPPVYGGTLASELPRLELSGRMFLRGSVGPPHAGVGQRFLFQRSNPERSLPTMGDRGVEPRPSGSLPDVRRYTCRPYGDYALACDSRNHGLNHVHYIRSVQCLEPRTGLEPALGPRPTGRCHTTHLDHRITVLCRVCAI